MQRLSYSHFGPVRLCQTNYLQNNRLIVFNAKQTLSSLSTYSNDNYDFHTVKNVDKESSFQKQKSLSSSFNSQRIVESICRNPNDSRNLWSIQSCRSFHTHALNSLSTKLTRQVHNRAIHLGRQTFNRTDSTRSEGSNRVNNEKDIPIQSETDIRDDILRESLKYVNDYGWSMDAIRAGIRATNQPTTVEGLFASGYDLVEYFMRDANSKMIAFMNEQATKDSQKSNLLIDGLKYRLSLVIPYANTWDQALAQGALPQNAMRSWKSLLELSNDTWHTIGDTSIDFNWYSKRLLLATVYKSAEIYMLQDQSQDKIDSINFLERRLNDFQILSSLKNTVSKSFSDGNQIISGLFSVVRNLTSRR